jgi:hypothetical protein
MYKRPNPRPVRALERNEPRERTWNYTDACVKTKQEMYRPVYQSEVYMDSLARHGQLTDEQEALIRSNMHVRNYIPKIKKIESPFPENVSNLYQRALKRPSVKELVDAMRLDEFPEKKVTEVRRFYAMTRNTEEKRQADLDKMFAKYNVKTSSTPKKILKVVKKKI